MELCLHGRVWVWAWGVRYEGCDGSVVELRSVASDYQLMLMIKFWQRNKYESPVLNVRVKLDSNFTVDKAVGLKYNIFWLD